MPGCGKEEFIDVACELGYSVLRMGDVVREHADGIRCGIGEFAHSERLEHHPAIWAERTVCRMDVSKSVVIDGVRSLDEIAFYGREFGEDLVIVAVHASPETRYERLISRARDDAPKDIVEFEARDQRELGWGIGDVIARADVMLVNEGTLDEFRESVATLFHKKLYK